MAAWACVYDTTVPTGHMFTIQLLQMGMCLRYNCFIWACVYDTTASNGHVYTIQLLHMGMCYDTFAPIGHVFKKQLFQLHGHVFTIRCTSITKLFINIVPVQIVYQYCTSAFVLCTTKE